ncbi:NADH:ubiquinone oxidoreductase, 24 kDa subunit [Candidatus Magnetoovum chiemensis]|nr:NADH:ubiquinone oxidoreductase, 24 kDa subunit [Candidatus Magnetoovum chiemensis]
MEESGKLKEKVKHLRTKYRTVQSSVLPALYEAQQEHGWLSQKALEDVSNATGVPKALVKGTATFYAMYKKKPQGKHLIQICTNVACMLDGAYDIVGFLKEKYELDAGGTTKDGKFSLVIMECIGACATSPAMLLDNDFYDNLTIDNISGILDKYS